MVDWIVFVVGSLLTLGGAVGVLAAKNPVHSALLLVQTLFGVAVLFVAQEAHFLAAVQIVVYAGAVVVLFLFVIMLLGVDRDIDHRSEVLKGQRPAAIVLGIIALAELVIISRVNFVLGNKSVSGVAVGDGTNVEKLGTQIFTRHIYAFEITSVLLIIAVVGAVLLSRKPKAPVEGDAK